MYFEAFFIGVKEGAKLLLCSGLILVFIRASRLDYLRSAFFSAMVSVTLLSLVMMMVPVTFETQETVVKAVGYVFGLTYFLSLLSLFEVSGTDVLGPLRSIMRNTAAMRILVFLSAMVYFLPDMAGTSLYLRDVSAMRGNAAAVYTASAAGFFLPLIGAFCARNRIPVPAARFLGLPQLLLSLALIKLFAGGVRGFAEFSLISSVQSGMMKLVHDIVHQTFVTLMVPDHPLLKVTAWNFIGFVFRETAGLWLSLFIFSIPLLIFLRRHLGSPVKVPDDFITGAQRRKYIREVRDNRLIRAVPVFIFLFAVTGLWFHEKDRISVTFYSPDPEPVSMSDGSLSIPIETPLRDLRDGMMHKFVVNLDGEDIRILVMQKSDGTLAVCLDACEICPPEGYVQGEKHVVCLYCRTPIAIDTLGKAGGCNPIPLEATVTDRTVELSGDELKKKWDMVKSGRTREKIR